jgi:hypothetical protein
MNDIYVFQNFEFNLMTSEQVIVYIGKRINTLRNQGFNNDQIGLIIFEDQLFVDCFIDPKYFEKVKRIFYQ